MGTSRRCENTRDVLGPARCAPLFVPHVWDAGQLGRFLGHVFFFFFYFVGKKVKTNLWEMGSLRLRTLRFHEEQLGD